MRFASILLAVTLLGGCSDLPKDPAETLDRVKERGTIRLGVIDGVEPDPAVERVLDTVARRTGARIVRISGHGEELLEGLEADRVDLVYGRFADDSPWASAVYFGQPPGFEGTPPPSMPFPRFAFRLGENGWISELEEAAQ